VTAISPAPAIAGQLIDLVGPEGYIHGFICVRPPCGKKPVAVSAASLTVHGDGQVVHKASGWGIGRVSRSGSAWKAEHAVDGSVTEHGAKVDAVKAVARAYNRGSHSGTQKPAPAPAPARGELAGDALWMSGEGAAPPVTDRREAALIQAVYYSNFFSYTNDYLRNGTPPSRSASTAAKAWGAQGFLGGKERMSMKPPVETDAKWIAGIGALRKLVASAPPFSRPAVLYRDVTDPDKVFGPVGSMKGRVFSDPGFMSTTVLADSAERYGGKGKIDPATGREPTGDKIVLHIPAGGGGLRTQPAFAKDHAREREFTFAPGTRWRVDDDKIVNGKRETHVTQLLPPDVKPGPAPTPVKPLIRAKEPWEGTGAGYLVNAETGDYVRDAAGKPVKG